MPYFVHPAGVPVTTERPNPCPCCGDDVTGGYHCYCTDTRYSPLTGAWWETFPKFETRAAAADHVGQSGQSIAFYCTRDEQLNWQYRERRRFDRDEYLRLPWLHVSDDARHAGSSRYYAIMEAVHKHEELQHQLPHLAIKHPGQIAFTLNDEHGFNDRQTVLRPGKYLERFFPGLLTTPERDRFCASCLQQTTAPELHIARTTRDITLIYNTVNEHINSCMQRKRSPGYDWQGRVDNGDQPHPCSIYGDSDLGIAYLGTLDNITARVLVWPDKQRFVNKFYGQESRLRAALEAAGYSAGSFSGARMRYVTCDDGIVMPYLDPDNCAEIDGRWLVIGHGDVDTQVTVGYTSEEDTEGTCDHCNDTTSRDTLNDNHGLCSDCYDQRSSCSECNETVWTDDDAYTSHDNGVWCESCATEKTRECAVSDCDRDWIEELLERSEQRNRRANGTTDLCVQCARTHQFCSDCDSWYDADTETDCPDCRASDDDDSVEPPAPAVALPTICRVCDNLSCICGNQS